MFAKIEDFQDCSGDEEDNDSNCQIGIDSRVGWCHTSCGQIIKGTAKQKERGQLNHRYNNLIFDISTENITNDIK